MGEEKKQTTKKIFVYLRIAFVLAGVTAGIIWVCGRQRYVKLGEILSRMNPAFIVGIVAVFALSQVILASRWWLLLRTQKVHISIRAAVRLHFLGLFYNNFMPGSLGGDLMRAWYVTKHTHRRFEAALTVFVDRLLGFTSSVIMAGFSYFVLLHGQKLGIAGAGDSAVAEGHYKGWVVWGLVILGLVAVVMLVLPAGRRLVKKAWEQGLKLAKKLWTAVVIYSRSPLTILAVFGLTFVLQGIVIVGFWLVGRHIGIEASVKYYFVFFPLTWALGAIPVSVGGAVVVEGSLVALFTVVAGVGAEQALAIALCQRVVWMVASLPGAFVHLAGGHLPKEIGIDYEGLGK
ncbi:MAG: lysylphosphatidylglycerol synthase transmembrane domain-containing protein [Planctomycetota bacterium]